MFYILNLNEVNHINDINIDKIVDFKIGFGDINKYTLPYGTKENFFFLPEVAEYKTVFENKKEMLDELKRVFNEIAHMVIKELEENNDINKKNIVVKIKELLKENVTKKLSKLEKEAQEMFEVLPENFYLFDKHNLKTHKISASDLVYHIGERYEGEGSDMSLDFSFCNYTYFVDEINSIVSRDNIFSSAEKFKEQIKNLKIENLSDSNVVMVFSKEKLKEVTEREFKKARSLIEKRQEEVEQVMEL